MTDRIERSIVVSAPRDKVWAAITEPAGIAGWFCSKGVRGTVAVGETVILVFGMSNGETAECAARIEAIDPKDRFAYRWRPGADSVAPIDSVPTTLVEFLLSDDGSGTKVTVVESGFASLPADMAETAFRNNDEGWAHEIAHLADYLNG